MSKANKEQTGSSLGFMLALTGQLFCLMLHLSNHGRGPQTSVTNDMCHQGQVSPRTRVTKDKCHQGHVSPRTRVTKDKCHQGRTWRKVCVAVSA